MSGLIVAYKHSYTYAHLLLYITFTDAAEILEPVVDKTEHIEEGKNVTLRCIGVGYPPPLVQWRKLHGLLNDRVSSTKMSMSTNEGNVTRVTVDLFITNVSREDTGDYECIATNLLNNVTRKISLIVQCMQSFVYVYNYLFQYDNLSNRLAWLYAYCMYYLIQTSFYFIKPGARRPQVGACLVS